MPRVREIEDDGGDPILKETFSRERELFGGLLNTTKIFAHCPPIMNQDYAELLTLIGKAATTTQKGEHVLALKRFSWFSVEFGLIEEHGETKVFGAGILSSTGEIPFSLSSDVVHRPFVTDEVIETDYDPSRMQDKLFIIPSFTFLRREIEQLVKRFGIAVL